MKLGPELRRKLMKDCCPTATGQSSYREVVSIAFMPSVVGGTELLFTKLSKETLQIFALNILPWLELFLAAGCR
jgi:hypothetical protein